MICLERQRRRWGNEFRKVRAPTTGRKKGEDGRRSATQRNMLKRTNHRTKGGNEKLVGNNGDRIRAGTASAEKFR